MRAKRYFWNMKHHKELDKRMGLSRRMAEPFARLCDACGIDSDLGGTKAIMPIFLFDNLDKVLPPKMLPLIVYDYFSKEIPHTFHRRSFRQN